MSDHVAEFQDTLQAHDANRAQGEAHISAIATTESTISVTFDLPTGDTTVERQWARADDPISTLYDITTASPPCIDTLVGETVPVRWDDMEGEWRLDVDALEDADKQDKQRAIVRTPPSTPREWSYDARASFYITVFVSFFGLGPVLGFVLGHGTPVEITVVIGLIVLAWFAFAVCSYSLFRDLYRGNYDWTAD